VVVDSDGQLATKLGISADKVVLELGWGEDSDEDLRDSVEEVLDSEILGEGDDDEPVDVVLLWFREEDGDLTDVIIDAQTMLNTGGVIWLLTPKSGKDGHVEPSDIADAALTGGLSQTSNLSVGPEWNATRLVSRRN
jgi:hypothetical protein